MAEKGVIIEYDFTVLNGAEVLFNTVKGHLKKIDNIKLDAPTEAKFLMGADYREGLARLFAEVKSKKSAEKAAREISAAFKEALEEEIAESLTAGFKNFVKALVEKDVKVVIATRANLETIQPVFEPLLGENVVLWQEGSSRYGTARWTSWAKACADNSLTRLSTLVMAGSGLGVKAALAAGLGSVAVTNERVAYQDFTGANEVVSELSVQAARKVLGVLRVD